MIFEQQEHCRALPALLQRCRKDPSGMQKMITQEQPTGNLEGNSIFSFISMGRS